MCSCALALISTTEQSTANRRSLARGFVYIVDCGRWSFLITANKEGRCEGQMSEETVATPRFPPSGQCDHWPTSKIMTGAATLLNLEDYLASMLERLRTSLQPQYAVIESSSMRRDIFDKNSVAWE